MKFQLAYNMERHSPALAMKDVERHAIEMVQLAEDGGFELVWAAEHHANELIVAPNPFLLLTRWANHTSRIRLGTGVVVAPYWHPIRLAEEAAMLDIYSDGRLDLGVGSGAFQYEFDRMAEGLQQTSGYRYLQEIVPAVIELWKGDYAHDGEYWRFPTATSVPKPLQQPHPPVWIAARSPLTYDWAVPRGYNIISWPLARPMSELEAYRQRFESALATKDLSVPRPRFAAMRHTAVYERSADWEKPVDLVTQWHGRFGNLFDTSGAVVNGFPAAADLAAIKSRDSFDARATHKHLMFGTPDEVIAKLKLYEALDIDTFIYFASFGHEFADQKRSLELFTREVMPEFVEEDPARLSAPA